MSSSVINPYAPDVLNGLNPFAPVGYVDVPFIYPYNVVLTANQELLNQQVVVMPDADFVWRARVVATATGLFAIRYSDSQGYYLSNGYILEYNLGNGVTASPTPIMPEIVIPAGGRIGIDIIDRSNAGNTIELHCIGVKRYRLGKQ